MKSEKEWRNLDSAMQLLWRNSTRRLGTALLAMFFAVACLAAPAHAQVETRAPYAILMDYDSGTVLFDKDSEKEMKPSSMTKIMTAYVVFDALKNGVISLNDKFHVSEKAWRMQGSKMFVKEGDDIRIEDLLRGVIIQSGNDACIVLAEGLAGSEEAFADDMNFMAERLGLKGSHFKNASGWPAEGHVMTAKDLAVLARRTIRDFPEHYHFYSETEFTYSGIRQPNRNGLLYKNIGADGLKTGYTEAAGYGLVGSAMQDGKRLIVVVNGLASSGERISEAQRLLMYGFREFKDIRLYEKGDRVENADVWLGDEAKVPLVVSEDVSLLVNKRKRFRPKIEVTVSYISPVPAPITKGQHVADLIIKEEGEVKHTYELVAGKNVDKVSFLGRMPAVFKYFFMGH